MEKLIAVIKELYALEDCEFRPVPGHDGGRNRVLIVSRNGEKKYALRISALGDRTEEDYLAETEFVYYLARNGAPVADVIPSVRGRLVECAEPDGEKCFISLFAYAGGILLYENGYRYREGVPIEEYFYNAGKALGAVHRLSKEYKPVHRRPDYADKFNRNTLGQLIPEKYPDLKKAVEDRLEAFRELPTDAENYGLVHFDFSDINFHVDLETGQITVFDFDNCLYCWYMFDLAHLWVQGVGWSYHERDPRKRLDYMKHYFDTVLDGYRSETDISEAWLEKLQLFIDMVLIENVADEFECCAREGEEPDDEWFLNAVECLVHDIPFAGIGPRL